MKLKQLYKSKTLDLNAAYVALVALLGGLGIEVDPQIVALGAAVMNWILRFVTNKPLSEK